MTTKSASRKPNELGRSIHAHLALRALLLSCTWAAPALAVTAGGIEFGEPTAVNVQAANDGDHDDEAHEVVSDGRGGWVVVWPGERGADGLFGRDEDVLVAHSSDGHTWSATT